MLLRGVLPGRALLVIMARIRAVYGPFVEAFKTGDVNLYDRQLKAAEKRLMQRGTYLVVERAREGAVRALLKKAWVLEGKPSRVTVSRFTKYLNAGMGGAGVLDDDEVECVLANMIFRVSTKWPDWRCASRELGIDLRHAGFTGADEGLHRSRPADCCSVQGQAVPLVSHSSTSRFSLAGPCSPDPPAQLHRYPPLRELPPAASEHRLAAEKAAFAKVPPPSQLVVVPAAS